MQAIAGIWIREKRIQKDWSQESLCHGICSVSYLSKIENGNIQVNEEIVNALLDRLGIHPMDQQDVEKIDAFYKGAFQHVHELMDVHFSKDELDIMENSLYCLDSFLIQYYQSQCLHQETNFYEKIQKYISFMNDRQLKLFYQVSLLEHRVDVDTFLHRYQSSDSYLVVAMVQFNQGKIASAVYYWTKAYEHACQEANVENMAMAQIGLGNIYCSLHEEELMKQCYQKVEKIIQVSHIDVDVNDLYYNAATLYIEQNQPQKALSILESVLVLAKMNKQLIYHKMALCYELLDENEKGIECIKKGFNESGDFDFLLEIVLYRFKHPNYIQEIEYEDLIRKGLDFCQKHLSYGFTLNMNTLLLEILEAQRRYKEAYCVMKDIFYKKS